MNIHDLLEQIPAKYIDNFKQHRYKGSTLILVKKRDLDEIKENLKDLANLLSKPIA